MLVLKLTRNLILGCLLAIMCANGNADLTQQEEASVVEVRNQYKRMGSAFAISKNLFITAHHVVDDEPVVNIVHGGYMHACRVIRLVPQQDMALLYAPTARVTHPLKLGHSTFLSQDVIIYGFPAARPFSRAVGNVIDTHSRMWYGTRSRYTGHCTAVVMGGYSGGPVVDRRTNDVVGILTNRNGMFYNQGQGYFSKVEDFGGLIR